MEFWWSLVHIFLMITASVVSFIALDKLSQTVTVNGQELKVSVLETEVIVIGVFCLLGEFSKFYHLFEIILKIKRTSSISSRFTGISKFIVNDTFY